jgi:protein-tyrosine-phosphatase
MSKSPPPVSTPDGVSLPILARAPRRAGSACLSRVSRADLIIALDSLIEAELRGRYPRADRKIAMLQTPNGDRPVLPIDIPDPYDGDETDVRRCYELLRSSVDRQASDLCAPDEGREKVKAHYAP